MSKTDIADSPYSNTALTQSVWQQVGLVFDSVATTNNATFYLNGVADGTITFNQNFDAYTRFIGRPKAGSSVGSHFKGGMALHKWFLDKKVASTEMLGFYNQERHLFNV